MAKIIILKNADGSCAITTPAPNARGVDVRQGEPIYEIRTRKKIIQEVSKETGQEMPKMVTEEYSELVGHQPGDVYDADGFLVAKALGREETEEEFLQRVAGIVADGRPWRISDTDKLPADRTFRGAWTDRNDTLTVDVDMDKAREIQRDNLRAARKPLLQQADIEFLQAVEAIIPSLKSNGIDVAQLEVVIEKKKELRDITAHPDIEKAKTPAALLKIGLPE